MYCINLRTSSSLNDFKAYFLLSSQAIHSTAFSYPLSAKSLRKAIVVFLTLSSSLLFIVNAFPKVSCMYLTLYSPSSRISLSFSPCFSSHAIQSSISIPPKLDHPKSGASLQSIRPVSIAFLIFSSSSLNSTYFCLLLLDSKSPPLDIRNFNSFLSKSKVYPASVIAFIKVSRCSLVDG